MPDVPTILSKLPQTRPSDFSAFGETEEVRLSRFQMITGGFLSRNWVTIPHVTHNDEVDITVCEQARLAWNLSTPDRKLTIQAPLMKSVAIALKSFPNFSASIGEQGDTLILKKYFNIGFAVESPTGLLVPVIRDCEKKSTSEIAASIAALSAKARTKGLTMLEMSGSSITVSSLGHIGGTSFSPIINAPDVAILGATKVREVATRGEHGAVVWRKMLPLSLSYDHRVINGGDAARFVRHIGELLQSPALTSLG